MVIASQVLHSAFVLRILVNLVLEQQDIAHVLKWVKALEKDEGRIF